MFLNHQVTSFQFCHWWTTLLFWVYVFVFFKIYLITFPSSLFVRFSNLYFALVRKSGLWSFIIVKHCCFAMMLRLPPGWNYLAIFFPSPLIFFGNEEFSFMQSIFLWALEVSISLYLSIYLSIYLPIYLSIYPTIYIYIYIYIYIAVYFVYCA